jgi:hypothetical protein
MAILHLSIRLYEPCIFAILKPTIFKFWRLIEGYMRINETLGLLPGLPRLSQVTSEILQAGSVIFYMDGSLCERKAGAGVFLDTLDISESYALGSLATVFQTEVYAMF